MSVSIAQPPIAKKLASLTAATTTGASTAFSMPVADAYTFYLNVTSAGQTTCNTAFQTSVDGGTTYLQVPWAFAGVTTVTGCYVLNVHIGVGPGTDNVSLPTGCGALMAISSTALSLQAVVDPRYMKLAYTITGTSPVADLYCIAWSRGSVGNQT